MIFVANNLNAQVANDGFFIGAWDKMTYEAKRKNKIMVVDFYADWCKPCKQMEQNVFVEPEVINYIKEHFIAYRLEVEKNVKGDMLKKRHNVEFYPTFIFFDPNGNELSRVTGYLNKTAFLAALKEYGPQIPNSRYTEFR